jgi:hypothetical protein
MSQATIHESKATFQAEESFQLQQLRMENQWLRLRIEKLKLHALSDNKPPLVLERERVPAHKN